MTEKLNIALVQSPLFWEEPEKNRTMFGRKIDTIPDDMDLIILPEMFTSGFTMEPENINALEGPRTVEWMLEKAKEKNAAITGSIIFQENGLFFNRLFFVYPSGEIKTYDKKHTFTLAGEDKVYQAGKDKLIVDFKGFKLCPLICYDLRFPVWARNVEDYDVLIYMANWPRPRIAAWDILLRARAIENMAYCIGVNCVGQDGLDYEYPGHSAAYDVLGNELVFSNTEEILYTTLEKGHIESTRKKLKFLEDRDAFNWIG